jgi:hypothetical protein
MTPDSIDTVMALLVATSEAHGRYEESELGGVYDQEWAEWYAAYAVEHGLADLLGHPVTAERLGAFLAATFEEFKRIDPEPDGGWAPYTSRRIVAEL